MTTNNIHDSVFTCPECHNKTLYPLESPGPLGIGYGEVCICDECGSEFKAVPEYDFTVNFEPLTEDDTDLVIM